MDFFLKIGDTSHPIPLLAISSTDHITGATGLNLATLLANTSVSKNGGVNAAAAGTFAELGKGYYGYTPTATEVNAGGVLALSLSGMTGVDPQNMSGLLVAFDPFDSSAGVWSTVLPGSYGANTGGNIVGNSPTLAATVSAIWTATTRSLTDKAGFSLAAGEYTSIASAVFSFVTETGITFLGFVRVATSALFGKSTNGGDTFRDFNDTKNRITGTVDALGNRTTMTTDQT